MKTKFVQFVSYVLLFLLIFDLSIPPLRALGSAFLVVIFLLPVIFLKRMSLTKSQWRLFFIYLLVLIYSIFTILLGQVSDYTYILSVLKAIVVLLAVYCYLNVFGYDDLENKIINVFFFNSIICLFFGVNDHLLPFVQFFKHGQGELIGYVPFRISSLSGSGYFGIAVGYGLVVSYIGYMVARDGKMSFSLAFKTLLIIIAGILSARTAFIAILFFFASLLFKKRKYFIYMMVSFLFIIIAIETLPFFNLYKTWILEVFNVFSSNGKMSSLSHLETMIFIPSEFSTLAFGNGIYVNEDGSYYMHTDSGYMRFLLFGGVLYLILTMLVAFYMACLTRSYNYFFSVTLLIFVFHIKGVVLINNAVIMSFMILTAFYIHNQKTIGQYG
ncbi:hypothetical protein D8S93_09310 [Vibrio sp. VGrn 2]|uniref:hypothetical protein n=1 Tax=Vibrio sp. VGrn 2 TaxID=2419839 RepID=UPI00128B5ADD|nr:hypothetical protein [Vibrio sp. VGrn 2]MPS38830.1 hypothetical protein [Vibrio sp. VGrn 2]